MLCIQNAGAVSSLRQRQGQPLAKKIHTSTDRKSREIMEYIVLFVPLQAVALKTEVCGLLRLCLCHEQAWAGSKAFVAFVQSAAVTRLLLCCPNWILQLRAVDF